MRETFASQVVSAFRDFLPEDREEIRQHALRLFDAGLTDPSSVIAWCSFSQTAGCPVPDAEDRQRR